MASTVNFKFKSAREYDSVSFPGTGIKLLDLKRAIVEQKKLHQGMEFDLKIVNDKTKEGAYIRGSGWASGRGVACLLILFCAGKGMLTGR